MSESLTYQEAGVLARDQAHTLFAVYLIAAKRLFGIRGGYQAQQDIREADAGWPALERATPRPSQTPGTMAG